MKLCISLLLSLFLINEGVAQNNIRLSVTWNDTDKKYEVFALSPDKSVSFVMGKSQITIVAPKAASNDRLKIQSFAGGSWVDEKIVLAPSSSSNNDFHRVVSNGSAFSLQAGKELLLFSFKFSDEECREGVRLYNNGADPVRTAAGMGGVDFSISIVENSGVQYYKTNSSNSGTKCMTCPVEFSLPQLIDESQK